MTQHNSVSHQCFRKHESKIYSILDKVLMDEVNCPCAALGMISAMTNQVASTTRSTLYALLKVGATEEIITDLKTAILEDLNQAQDLINDEYIGILREINNTKGAKG